MYKKIIIVLLAILSITPVMAGQYHAGDDNINSSWLKTLNDYLFTEGTEELNKDNSPPEWITTAEGPRLDYLHDDIYDNPLPLPKTYNLVDGPTINSKLREINSVNKVKSIEFIDTKMPTSGVTEITGIDLDGDNGVVGWYAIDPADNMAKIYISTQKVGQKVIANPDCHEFFSYLDKVNYIDVSLLDTSDVTNMRYMFFFTGYKTPTLTFEIIGLNSWNV